MDNYGTMILVYLISENENQERRIKKDSKTGRTIKK